MEATSAPPNLLPGIVHFLRPGSSRGAAAKRQLGAARSRAARGRVQRPCRGKNSAAMRGVSIPNGSGEERVVAAGKETFHCSVMRRACKERGEWRLQIPTWTKWQWGDADGDGEADPPTSVLIANT